MQKVTKIFNIKLYAISYKHAGETVVNKTSEGTSCTVNLWFADHVGTNQHRYNRPTVDEISVDFISENVEPPGHNYLVVHSLEGGPKMLSIYSLHCDNIMYPL
jgi:hypothetical protein